MSKELNISKAELIPEPKLRLLEKEEGLKSLETIAVEKSQSETGSLQEQKRALDNEVDNFKARKPKFGSSFGLIGETNETWFRREIDRLNDTVKRAQTDFFSRIDIAQKCIPTISGGIYKEKTAEITMEIANIVNVQDALKGVAENAPSSFNEIATKPQFQLALIERRFMEELDAKSSEYFNPLINTARGDVRQFLIRHFNSGDLSVDEAQNIISEKHKIELPIKFTFRTVLFNVGDKKDRPGVLGQATNEEITLFLDDIKFLDDGKLDEAELLDTIIHEIIHSVSAKEGGNTGLEKEKIFNIENPRQSNSPETNLNELVTQLITIEIASKYYDRNRPTAIDFKRTEKQGISGYQDLVEGFIALKNKHPDEISGFLKIAAASMLTGNMDKIRDFFSKNQDIYQELENIVSA